MTVNPQPTAMPPTSSPPPCSGAPERWFDRTHRLHALAACLQCPARRWCAQEALRTKAAWGMWAGIWIDGRLDEVAHYLDAIATDARSFPTRGLQTGGEACAPPQERVRMSLPPVAPIGGSRPGSVSAAVLARSSGHCEVMDAECRVAAETHICRIAGRVAGDPTSAATVYAACAGCADRVTRNPMSARRLGYVVDSVAQATNAPFYWRQCRWVLLGRAGQLFGTSPAAEATRAS